jgi:hypothetical protein
MCHYPVRLPQSRHEINFKGYLFSISLQIYAVYIHSYANYYTTIGLYPSSFTKPFCSLHSFVVQGMMPVMGEHEVWLRFRGLWWWHFNITIRILDIIHRPIFYLKLNWTLYVCPYLTGNTLLLRYEPNRLILSIGLWGWHINITITILDRVKVKVTLRPTYESASPSWRQAPIWNPRPN